MRWWWLGAAVQVRHAQVRRQRAQVVRDGDGRGLHRTGVLPVCRGQPAEPGTRQGPARREPALRRAAQEAEADADADAAAQEASARRGRGRLIRDDGRRPREGREGGGGRRRGDDDEVAGGASEDEELAWLEEIFRMGHWGFGHVSFSGN